MTRANSVIASPRLKSTATTETAKNHSVTTTSYLTESVVQNVQVSELTHGVRA